MKPAFYHPEAQQELTAASLFYEDRQPNLGSRFLAAVEACEEVLAVHPVIGSPFESDTRRVMVKGFPNQLVYKDYGDHLFVFAVAHCSRKPGYWARRR